MRGHECIKLHADMRTTVTIDNELLAQAKVSAARTHRTIGSVLEDALRRFIGPVPPRRRPRVRAAGLLVRARAAARVDLFDREQIADLQDGNALA